MFYSLWDAGIQGKAWRLLKALYERVENKVIFGAFESEWFEVFNGVKQGCILSPTLFSIVMNDLLSMLEKEGLGIKYKETLVSALLYADDTVLLAESQDQ